MYKSGLFIILVLFLVSSVAFSEIAICTSPGWQIRPKVNGNIVIWEDNRNGSIVGVYDIYGYDMETETEFEVCVCDEQQYESSIGGGVAVWADWRNGQRDIYGYDIQRQKEFVVSEYSSFKSRPTTDGNFVYWTDERGGKREIYVYDISNGARSLLYADSNDLVGIDVDGNIAVWMNFKRVDGFIVSKDIQGYNLETSEAFMICADSANQTSPAISGERVVWVDSRNNVDGEPSNSDIYGCNLESGVAFPICTARGDQHQPDINNDIVVWKDYRNGNADIYGYSFETHEEFAICLQNNNQLNPRINDSGVVVWEHCVSFYNSDIYALKLGSEGDFFRYAIGVSAGQCYEGSTSGATGMDVTDDGYKDYADIWHLFVPDEDGLYRVSLCDSDFDTTLSVFDMYQVEIEFNDNFCGLQSSLILRAKAGERYYIRVAGYDGDRGDYKLNIVGGIGPLSRHDSNYDGVIDFFDFADFAEDWLKNN